MTTRIWPAATAGSASTDPHPVGALVVIATRLAAANDRSRARLGDARGVIGELSSSLVQHAARTVGAAADALDDESATSSEGRRRRPSRRRLQCALADRERRVEIEQARLARAAIVAHDAEVRRLEREHERARISALLVEQPQVETDFPGAVG